MHATLDRLLASWAFRALAGAVLLIVLTIPLLEFHPASYTTTRSLLGKSDVYNRTLGFEKVFAIGFPSRTDKHDALALASSFSDIDLTWSDGVAFDDIPEKAIPEALSHVKFSTSAIGCWRAHLNVLSTMVEKNIQTALIFEDDNDWDVSIKSQLDVFAKGVSMLQDDKGEASLSGSPYGNNWDMLWLGTCHAGPRDTGLNTSTGIKPSTQKMYVIKNDPTVPPWHFRKAKWKNDYIMPEILANDTRVIFETGGGLCTWGYAVTRNAARKIISTLSLEGGFNEQIDMSYSRLAEQGILKSYAIYPPLTGTHHFAGSPARDSDIKQVWRPAPHPEFTLNVVYSTIMNVPRLVDGATDAVSQFPKDTIPLRRLDENYAAQVSGELRHVDVRSMHEQSVRGVNAEGTLDVAAYDSLVARFL